MDRGYRFVTTCVGSTYEAISSLKESEVRISLRTFREAIGKEAWRELQAALGYDRHLPITRDFHVGYFRGVYLGLPAVFLRWSGIEHIYALRKLEFACFRDGAYHLSMPRPFDLNVQPAEKRASRPFNSEQPATQLTGQMIPFKDQCAAQTVQGNIPWPPAGPACPSGKPFRV